MSPHNDYVLSGVLALLFNVVPFSDPTASIGEETSAVFSHERLQTVTLLPRGVSVSLPRLLICSSKKESVVSRALSRIWQFPPENQNWANGNNRCDWRCETWSSALVVMFPWGLVVSWGSLNQLGGVAVRRLFLRAHSLSCRFTQLDHFFFLLLQNLFWSTVPLKFLVQYSLCWGQHVPVVLYSQREYQKHFSL